MTQQTPFQLRFEIFQLARQHLFDQYLIGKEVGGPATLQVPYPSFEQIDVLAKKIKGFVETQ